MDSSLKIREITAQQTYRLRHIVLRPNQTLADCAYPNDDSAGAYHIGGFLNDRLVVIASVTQEREQRFETFSSSNQYRLRGMASEPEVRGRGFGSDVLSACLERCWSEGGETFWCNARTSAAEFYQKKGFSTLPEEFEIPGIGPHVVMYINKLTA